MHTNLPCTEITSRNAKISTLDPNNFFVAAYFYTKFDENSYIYVYYISLPKFAPFLSNLKKSDSLRIPSIRTKQVIKVMRAKDKGGKKIGSNNINR